MEALKEITSRSLPQIRVSQTFLPNISESHKKSDNEVSIYTGELTAQGLVENVVKIRKAFVALPDGYYDILIERIKANGFSDSRLEDAVNHVIETCPYPTPTIANFISYDKTVNVMTYDEIMKKADKGEITWGQYRSVKLIGRPRPVWVHVNDVEKLKHLIEN